MSFLYPAVLSGLAAVSIPIAIHLLNKFRVKTTDWAAMRFLVDSLRKNERKVKLQDLLLLLLRCAFIVALVLAFGRPVLKGPAAENQDGTSVAAIVLLDTSASMSQTNGVLRKFDQARNELLHWLDRTSPDSVIGLHLVSNRVDEVIAQPTTDHAQIRRMLDGAQPSDRNSDLPAALRRACETLADLSGRPREIRIYTDDQSSVWKKVDELTRIAAEYKEVRVIPVQIGPSAENNLAITSIGIDGTLPTASLPCRVRVEVSNFGSTPVRDIPVTLQLQNGETAGGQSTAEIPSGGRDFLYFPMTFPTPGPQLLTASIPSDALPADNQRAFAVEVIRQMNVLLVDDSTPESNMERDGYYLLNALLPIKPENAERHYLAVNVCRIDQLTRETAATADAVFLCNIPSLSVAQAKTLRAYVANGGGLVVFPGARTDLKAWNQNQVWSELLPAKLGPVESVAEGAAPFYWQNSNFEHPISAFWNESSQGTPGSIQVTNRFLLLGESTVIIRFADGTPAGVEGKLENGRVILFAVPATPDWSNLPLHPAFLPLIQRSLAFVTRDRQVQLNYPAGEAIVFAVPPDSIGKACTLKAADSDKVIGSTQVDPENGRSFVRFSAPEKAGGYRIETDGQLIRTVAVQLPAEESDLRQIDRSKLESAFQTARQIGNNGPARTVIRQEFWTLLIWIAVLIAGAELALAHRFSLAR